MQDPVAFTERPAQPGRRLDLMQPVMHAGEKARVPEGEPGTPAKTGQHVSAGNPGHDQVGAVSFVDFRHRKASRAKVVHQPRLDVDVGLNAIPAQHPLAVEFVDISGPPGADQPPRRPAVAHGIIPSPGDPPRPPLRNTSRTTEEPHPMDYGSYQHLLFERHDNGVLLITMNRPEVYNAADEVMHG